MSNLKRVDQVLRSLREDVQSSEVARLIGEAAKARFPKGRLSFEPANEYGSFQGLRAYKVRSGAPITIEFEFEDEMPQGPDDHQRDQYHRDHKAMMDAAMEDWRDFLTNELSKVADGVKRGMEVTDVKTPYVDQAVVTFEQGSL